MLGKSHDIFLRVFSQYLKCIDKDEMEILIPLSHRGKFNAIYEKGKLNQHSVYSMKDILNDLKLPIKVS